MDIKIRLVLLVIGLFILLGVIIDFMRRRSTKDLKGKNQLFSSVIRRKTFAVKPSYLDDAEYSDVEPQLELYIPSEPEIDLEPLAEPELAVEPEPELQPVIAESPKTVISIYIMSRERHGFKGSELLSAATNAHFHFGKNDVFNRHENIDGSGEILFSLIKAHEPGCFYIDLLKQEHVSGIALIMLPDSVQNPTAALDKLIRAAKQMAFVLNGELLDNKREALTLTTINNYAAQLKFNANR